MIVIVMGDEGPPVAYVPEGKEVPHIVIIHEGGKWTDSPVLVSSTEDAMAEEVAAYRNEGYEDRNP